MPVNLIKGRILVVDDELWVRTLPQERLAQDKYDCQGALRGRWK